MKQFAACLILGVSVCVATAADVTPGTEAKKCSRGSNATIIADLNIDTRAEFNTEPVTEPDPETKLMLLSGPDILNRPPR